MLTNRKKLFVIQLVITVSLFVVSGFILVVHGDLKVQNPVGLFYAPFGSILFLFFLLFLVKTIIMDFPDTPFSPTQIIGSSTLLAVFALASLIILEVFFKLNTLEIILFFLLLFLSFVLLMGFRIGNIWTMGIITGIAEGIVIYMVFIYK